MPTGFGLIGTFTFHYQIPTLVMAALASLDTLQLDGRQSLIILVTIEAGRVRSSGFSAIFILFDLESSRSKKGKRKEIVNFFVSFHTFLIFFGTVP